MAFWPAILGLRCAPTSLAVVVKEGYPLGEGCRQCRDRLAPGCQQLPCRSQKELPALLQLKGGSLTRGHEVQSCRGLVGKTAKELHLQSWGEAVSRLPKKLSQGGISDLCPPGVLQHIAASRRWDLPKQPRGREPQGSMTWARSPQIKSYCPCAAFWVSTMPCGSNALFSEQFPPYSHLPPLPSKLQTFNTLASGPLPHFSFQQNSISSTKMNPNVSPKP